MHTLLNPLLQEAIEAESFVECKPLRIQRGDLETGFVESDHVLRGEMRLGGQVCYSLCNAVKRSQFPCAKQRKVVS